MIGLGKIKLIFGVFLVMFLSSFTTPDKQMSRLVSKIWKGEEVVMKSIEIPENYKVDIPILNKVMIDNKLKGFACFTTAFGCKIGGCAAASTPNDESYETFDYIIIYNTSLSILKVDIANYPGAYGYEICRANWLKQFEGSTDGFELNKNIDGVSGATVSATYLIQSLNKVGGIVKILKSQAYL